MTYLSSTVSVWILAGALLVAQPASACGAPVMVQRIEGTGAAAVLLGDGSVWVQGRSGAATGPALVKLAVLRDIVQLAADGGHLYARQSDGRVWRWSPGSAAMPRPVRGLAGKAIDMAVGNDGQLAVRVRRLEFHSDVGRLVERQLVLGVAGPVAIAKAASQPARSAQVAAAR